MGGSEPEETRQYGQAMVEPLEMKIEEGKKYLFIT
jgi:hypothetical protein